jgi:hypothetical protein
MSDKSSPISPSSIPTNITDFYHAGLATVKLDHYRPENQGDMTVKILKAFMEFLPNDGASNLAEDILGCDSDEKIKQLADNLHTGVLLPSK